MATRGNNSTATAQAQALPNEVGPAQTVLIVDDRPINRDFLVSLLKHFGYKLREAESAEQAWGMAVEGELDLIITDVHMNGMDGYMFLEKLAANPATAHIPAIVYTAAHKNPEVERFVRAHKLYAVLTKPCAPEVIVQTVQSALGEPAQAGGDTPVASQHQRQIGDHRTTTLIEMMLDLAEEVEPAQLLLAFCKAAKALLRSSESFVYALPVEDTPAQSFYSGPTDNEQPEPLDEARLSATLAQITIGHAIGRFRNVNPRDYGIPLGDGRVSCLMCLPIFTSNRDYGCLCLLGMADADDFGEEDERLAMTLTSHLAVLYENTVFFAQMEGLASRLAHEMEDRKRAEEELDRIRKEQIRLKDEFLSHVSHELRSPVMAVQQFLEILQEGMAGEISPQQREYVDIALRNTSRLNSMIGDLLDATRMEAGKLRVELGSMPLADVLREAVVSARPTAEHKGITLKLDMPVELPLVLADRSRVWQIVTNLLDNAIKFTSQDGSVEVRAGLDPDAPGFVRVTVSDTGCGLTPEDMEKVFERHYQVPNTDCAARKGLGLGLCICKQLVTLQGGKIQVQSQPAAGSTFSFTLPVFSVANMLAPLLSSHRREKGLVVLSVELAYPEGNENKDLLPAMRETIERCVLPDLDVVLPGSYPTRAGGMVLVVAQADESGAQVMARRIEEQLKLNRKIADSSANPVLQFAVVDLPAADEGLNPQAQLAAAVECVDARLRSMIAQRN